MRLIAVAIAVSALELGCSSWFCRNKVVSETLRPGGAYLAVVFDRNCWVGPLSTHVSLISLKAVSDSNTGNILVASTPDSLPPKIEARWLDRGTLEIVLPAAVKISKSVSTWNGIRVLFADTENAESPVEQEP